MLVDSALGRILLAYAIRRCSCGHHFKLRISAYRQWLTGDTLEVLFLRTYLLLGAFPYLTATCRRQYFVLVTGSKPSRLRSLYQRFLCSPCSCIGHFCTSLCIFCKDPLFGGCSSIQTCYLHACSTPPPRLMHSLRQFLALQHFVLSRGVSVTHLPSPLST